MTDAESPDVENGAAAIIGHDLKMQNIVTYVISIRSGAPSEDLRAPAEGTEGEVFESGDLPALRSVFQRIDKLERAKLVASQTTWLEYFQPFAAGGLGLLLLHQAASFWLRFTPW